MTGRFGMGLLEPAFGVALLLLTSCATPGSVMSAVLYRAAFGLTLTPVGSILGVT